MITGKIYVLFVKSLMFAFLPLVHLYQSACSDLILNTAAEEATGLEKWANEFLIPYQFIFCGKTAKLSTKERYHFSPRFSYEHNFWPKAGLALATLPISLTVGATCKALSFLSLETQMRYQKMKKSFSSYFVSIDSDLYKAIGIETGKEAQKFFSQNYLRRKGDENHFKEEKQALREITERLNQAGIVWWVDCGTCIGAYRYGGIIPWDDDLDLALLLPDFENVLHALSGLNTQKYIVEDWSGRDFPNSYIKVFMKENNSFIDLYFFKVDVEQKKIIHLFSLDKHTFVPEALKERERSFVVPTPFEITFPLKKGLFDGVEVFLPKDPEKYLQLRYGENLAPAKIFNPETNAYEKDPSHPYWQRAYAH